MQSTHQDGQFELLEKTIGEVFMVIWAIGKNDHMMIHDDSLLHGGLIGVITLITQIRGNKYLGKNVLPCYTHLDGQFELLERMIGWWFMMIHYYMAG